MYPVQALILSDAPGAVHAVVCGQVGGRDPGAWEPRRVGRAACPVVAVSPHTFRIHIRETRHSGPGGRPAATARTAPNSAQSPHRPGACAATNSENTAAVSAEGAAKSAPDAKMAASIRLWVCAGSACIVSSMMSVDPTSQRPRMSGRVPQNVAQADTTSMAAVQPEHGPTPPSHDQGCAEKKSRTRRTQMAMEAGSAWAEFCGTRPDTIPI